MGRVRQYFGNIIRPSACYNDYMSLRLKILLFFVCAAALSCPVPSSGAGGQSTEKRVTVLEKKVVKIENRLTRLETGKPGEASVAPVNAEKPLSQNPLNMIYVSKEQLIGSKKSGIKINLKIENPTRVRINAFLGDIILKDETSKPFYKYKFYYNQPLLPFSSIDAVVLIMDSQTKLYLKLLRTGRLKVEFANQRIFSENDL